MTKENLGLFDTAPSRRQIQAASAVAVVLLVAVLVVIALPEIKLREINAVVPIIDSIMFISDLTIATLFFVQAKVFRSRALTILASTFVLSALLLVTHLLTFPGVFAPDGLLGAGLNTTGWTYLLRRAAIPIGIAFYVLLNQWERSKRPQINPPPPILGGIISSVTLAAALTLLVTIGHDLLPPLFFDRVQAIPSSLIVANLVLGTMILAAMAALRMTHKSVLDMWLMVALASWLVQLPLSAFEWGRFSTHFYVQFALQPLLSLILMLALLAEASRLYTRLAISTAANKRERDARLMTADAIAAAIHHEIGQPLTGVQLSASAALKWLRRSKPNVDLARKSLKDALDANGRTLDILKGLRAMFSGQSATISDFQVNALTRETAALLDRELAAQKIELQFDLDDAEPSIMGNRAQIQRVVSNLLINAIESLAETHQRSRRVVIRTALEGQAVLIEVSDTGRGIAPEKMKQVFEPFFTTKATGSGLGLSLSRTVIEDHGGRLWASADNHHGITFHLSLPLAQKLIIQ
jgi:signal transduction histidine kinase